jgi:putative spermidine/putrescine transport system substrate-binding protein
MKTFALCAATLALLSAAPTATVADELTIVSLGVVSRDAVAASYFTPFKEATGTRVKTFTWDGSMSFIEAMVKTGKPVWNVVEVAAPEPVQGCEQGLFEKFDQNRIGRKADFIPTTISACGSGMFTSAMVVAYNPAKVQTAPSSWADFWNLKQFPGKRGLPASAKYTLEIALLADGVASGDV